MRSWDSGEGKPFNLRSHTGRTVESTSGKSIHGVTQCLSENNTPLRNALPFMWFSRPLADAAIESNFLTEGEMTVKSESIVQPQ